jgi:hypothetical protein
MRLLVYVALTAALAAPAQAEELETRKGPSLAAQAQAQATLAYSQPNSWQRRVSRSRGTGRSTKKAVIIGAIAGGAAGLVTGLALENIMCECGPGPLSGGLTAAGAGAGAAIGWAVSLR